MSWRPVKSTKRAIHVADIGVVRVGVDDESHQRVGVESPSDYHSKLTQVEERCLAQEVETVIAGQAFPRLNPLSNRLESGSCSHRFASDGLEQVSLLNQTTELIESVPLIRPQPVAKVAKIAGEFLGCSKVSRVTRSRLVDLFHARVEGPLQ